MSTQKDNKYNSDDLKINLETIKIRNQLYQTIDSKGSQNHEDIL